MTSAHTFVQGSDIAQVAINDIGHCYTFGGTRGVSGNGCADCSGEVNWWIGAVWKLAIPGFPAGTYDGSVHGPSTLGWLNWQGQGVGSIDRSEVQAGDIPCWRTHMGIAISNTEMVSGLNAQEGVVRTPIDGLISGEQLICLRLAVIGPGGITLPTPAFTGAAQIDSITRDIARQAVRLVEQRMRIRTIGRPEARPWR